jgi:hypothetical protein
MVRRAMLTAVRASLESYSYQRIQLVLSFSCVIKFISNLKDQKDQRRTRIRVSQSVREGLLIYRNLDNLGHSQSILM